MHVVRGNVLRETAPLKSFEIENCDLTPHDQSREGDNHKEQSPVVIELPELPSASDSDIENETLTDLNETAIRVPEENDITLQNLDSQFMSLESPVTSPLTQLIPQSQSVDCAENLNQSAGKNEQQG